MPRAKHSGKRASVTGCLPTECNRDWMFGSSLGRCHEGGRGSDRKRSGNKELIKLNIHMAGSVLFPTQEEFSLRIAENQVIANAQRGASYGMAILIHDLAAENVFGKLEIRRCPRPILATPVEHRIAVSGVLHRSVGRDIRRSIHLNATKRLQTEVE